MIEGKPATFAFATYKFSTFSYREPPESEERMTLHFLPSGVYTEETGLFELTLDFEARLKIDPAHRVVQLKCIGSYQFDKGLSINLIPPYFYKNAVAILFPYIRSFVSTLTLQSNNGTLLMGLMNLTNLEKPLKDNTRKSTSPEIPRKNLKTVEQPATRKKRKV